MPDTYLTINQLAELLGIGRSSIYRRIEDGTLPKPIKLGKLSRFSENAVVAALQELGNTSDREAR